MLSRRSNSFQFVNEWSQKKNCPTSLFLSTNIRQAYSLKNTMKFIWNNRISSIQEKIKKRWCIIQKTYFFIISRQVFVRKTKFNWCKKFVHSFFFIIQLNSFFEYNKVLMKTHCLFCVWINDTPILLTLGHKKNKKKNN